MRIDGIAMNCPTYNAAMWSCVKSGSMSPTALSLFEEMEKEGVTPDIESYTAAIWACEQTDNWERAVELLKLAKFANLKRTASAFDGALCAVERGKQWELSYDMLKWMDRDNVKKTYVSYKSSIHALMAAEQYKLAMEVYLVALREGYYSPWIPGTRQIDISSFTTPIAKIAMLNVLNSIQSGKLAPFNMKIVYGFINEEIKDECVDNPLQLVSSNDMIEDQSLGCDDLDINELIRFLSSLSSNNVLVISKVTDAESKSKLLVISRESLLQYSGYGQEG
jgi:pentatricopeptide repeat protein